MILTKSTARSNPTILATVAALASVGMGLLFYQARTIDSQFSTSVGSFVRAICNLPLIFILWTREPKQFLFLSPKRHPYLWAWAGFGGLTVVSFFLAITFLGSGRASFLHALGTLVSLALVPLFLKEKVTFRQALCFLGCVFSVRLLNTSSEINFLYGAISLAVLSGIFASCAYLVVAKTRAMYNPFQIMLYWTLVVLIIHFGIWFFFGPVWPKSITTWIDLIGSGLCASVAQLFLTEAFKLGDAIKVTTIGYLTPILSLFFDVLFFGISVTPMNFFGAGIILTLAFISTRD